MSAAHEKPEGESTEPSHSTPAAPQAPGACGAPTAADGGGASGAQQAFEAAYQGYLTALAHIQEDVQRAATQASAGYRRALLESWLQLNTPEDVRRAHQAWQSAAAGGGLDLEARAADAYRAFLAAVQQAWAKADLSTVDPVLLNGIGNSLLVVANCAYAQRGRAKPAT